MSLLNELIENTMNNSAPAVETPQAEIITLPVSNPVVEQSPIIGTDYAGKEYKMFSVESAPIEGPYGTLEGKQGLFVNKQNINIVSDRYEVHQPAEVLNQFNQVAEKTGLQVNRVLPNPKNGGLLISAKYGDAVNFNGDSHDINLVFYTSHCGKYKTFLTLDTLRMACFNQLPALYRNQQRFIFSEKHYKNALDIEVIGKTLEGIPTSLEAHAETLEILGQKSFDFDSFVDLYKQHYKLNSEQKQYQTKLDKIKSVYYNAPGQQHLGENAYKALQAVTYMNTHEGRNTSMKEENSLIKGGNDSLVFVEELLEA